MPRENVIERTFKCDDCGKAYSYKPGLCTHIRLKHKDKYEERMRHKGGRLAVIKIKSTSELLDVNLDDLISDIHGMKKLISESETVRQFLANGKIHKNWQAVLVALLKGNIIINDGKILYADKAVPISDDIFKPLTQNFITALEEHLFENVANKESYVLKNLYEIHQIVQNLDEELPFHTLEVRRLAEKSLRT